MSLVLEALRRVEKPDARTGSVGVAVASYRPARKRRSALIPLLMGLGTGGALILLLDPRSRTPAPAARSPLSAAPSKGAPEPPFSAAVSVAPPSSSTEPTRQVLPRPNDATVPAPGPSRNTAGERGNPSPRLVALRAARPAPAELTAPAPLILQAISERDSYPIAVINDQLVKEGELIGRVRVLRIGSESVDVLLENGRKDTVRFAPPPPPGTLPTPDPD